MSNTKVDDKMFCDKCNNKAPEQIKQLAFFETKPEYPREEQLKILNELECGVPISNGRAFEGQVHFQHAYQTSVQRWFPYREGYSITLVNTFIENLLTFK